MRLLHNPAVDWLDTELQSLKVELRERALAIAEREVDLNRWEEDLERRDARLERQGKALRRRRLQVVRRLLRLRGRMPAPVAGQNGAAPLLDEALEQRAVEAAAVETEPEPASSEGRLSRAGSPRTKTSAPDRA